MNNVLFQKCIVPANEGTAGEPAIVIVTQESNCVLVWLSSFEAHRILKDFPARDNAIEWAVLCAPTIAKQILFEEGYERAVENATKSTREQVQP